MPVEARSLSRRKPESRWQLGRRTLTTDGPMITLSEIRTKWLIYEPNYRKEHSMRLTPRPSSATFIDFQDCYDALAEFKGVGARNVDFKRLLEIDEGVRRKHKLPLDRPIIGFATVDTRATPDDPQDRFTRAVEKAGIVLERIDYRDAFLDPGAGRASPDDGPRPRGVQTLAPAVSFALGALATSDGPSVVLVAGGFDHSYAVRNFAQQGGKVFLAFWRSCVDQRFFSRKIDTIPGVTFIDLEQTPEVLGLGAHAAVGGMKPAGLSVLF